MIDLDELELLEKAATPGPWSKDPDDDYFALFGRDGQHVANDVYGVDSDLILALRNSDLIKELRELRAYAAAQNTCVVCECDLQAQIVAPHCLDTCSPDDEQESDFVVAQTERARRLGLLPEDK